MARELQKIYENDKNRWSRLYLPIGQTSQASLGEAAKSVLK